ncbi:acyl-CoA/acyl-ACP dehydrogenase [Frankia sp. CNm7]|uniref:Acyl-CoA/acyl-ACP dehydrogenase n=1 Tax=Frankia nepalensis TaxID=1836974 RepID=A0A937RLZ2_9ACTN|nr:acyl-CoA dehydrogenase family protein [Frankia nepalensis]MBL7499836.1 acyl-CoA/acyl-ACP dehydrogenase [Frankia nepalensis]MBL7514237.1 acyl-CoA/acyl-ACP dehydrogenase [Frankia nepalensis]MBL7519723.1 acyl-CoA/acyl-ACP dehydrogenase [Frankia nepalensis]MBL7631264.1 acyl-CoA/acyl-ACP dehydrogenase [Frankia nepalensis]
MSAAPERTRDTVTATDAPTYTFPVPDLSAEALAAVTAEIAATAAEYDRSGQIPVRGLEAAHRAGLLTAAVGTQFGGPGLGPRDLVRILTALGEGDASVGLLAANLLGTHAGQAAHPHWPAAYYDDLLLRSRGGPALVNAIRAEPELGAPARGGIPKTTATRTADGWVLSGHKAYASGGAALAYHVVWAVADEPDGDPERPRVGHLIVPAEAPGIRWIETWDHLGLRSSHTHDVVYDGVELPADAFVEIPRGPDGVYRDPAAQAGPAGFGHAALYVGVARAARSAFAEFARSRVPTALGRPIATTERIQAVAGEVDLQIVQAETLLHGALLRFEAGDTSILPELSAIKVAIGRSVIAATQTAVAALGNPGLSRHHPLERHLRDALCIRVHPPQEDVVLLTAGRRVLGV